MILYFLLYSVFTFLLVNSEKTGVLPTHSKESKSHAPLNDVVNDKTRIALPSEGGTLIANTPDFSLLKDKQQVSLLALDEELNKPKQTSVVARKGAPNIAELPMKNTSDLQNSTGLLKTGIEKNESNISFSKNESYTNSTLAFSTPKNDTKVTPKNTTKVTPKKPLVVSYEVLAALDKNVNDELKIQNTNPSSKPLPNLTKNQIPSPNDDAIIKVYPSRATSHPGMLMPIIITILVVPMFAIVGYMALKRGQEAWKNRHYKRMDFLLDGMYND